MSVSTKSTQSSSKQTAKKQKKEGFFQRISKYIRDTRSEVKKVVWPSRSQIVNNTFIVLVCIAIVGAFIGLLDFGFTEALRLLLDLMGSL